MGPPAPASGPTDGSDFVGGQPQAGSGSISWSDLGRGLYSGALSIPESLARLGDYMGSDTAGKVADVFENERKYQMLRASPAFQRAASASVLPSADNNIYDEGVLRSIESQGVLALPSIVATLLPGAVVARGLRAAGAAAEAAGIGGATAAGASQAAVTPGQIYGGILDAVRETPDDELRKTSPAYSDMRAKGLDEDQAKEALARTSAGLKPVIGGALAAAAVAIGEGKLISDVAIGGAKYGVVSRALTGAARDAATQGVQAGGTEALTQAGISDATDKPFDTKAVLTAAAAGVAQGGLLGGALGALAKGEGRLPTVPKNDTGELVDTPSVRAKSVMGDSASHVVDPAQQMAMEAVKPPEPAPAKAPEAPAATEPAKPAEPAIQPAPGEPAEPPVAPLSKPASEPTAPVAPATPAEPAAPVAPVEPAPAAPAAPPEDPARRLATGGPETAEGAPASAPAGDDPARAPAGATPVPQLITTPQPDAVGEAARQVLAKMTEQLPRSATPDELVASILNDVRQGVGERPALEQSPAMLMQFIQRTVREQLQARAAEPADTAPYRAAPTDPEVGRAAPRTRVTADGSHTADSWDAVRQDIAAGNRRQEKLDTFKKRVLDRAKIDPEDPFYQQAKDVVASGQGQQGGNNRARSELLNTLRDQEVTYHAGKLDAERNAALVNEAAPTEPATIEQILRDHPAEPGEKHDAWNERMGRIIADAEARGVPLDKTLERIKELQAGEGKVTRAKAVKLKQDMDIAEFAAKRPDVQVARTGKEQAGIDAKMLLTRPSAEQTSQGRGAGSEDVDGNDWVPGEGRATDEDTLINFRKDTDTGGYGYEHGGVQRRISLQPDGSVHVDLRSNAGTTREVIPASRTGTIREALGATQMNAPYEGQLKTQLSRLVGDVRVVRVPEGSQALPGKVLGAFIRDYSKPDDPGIIVVGKHATPSDLAETVLHEAVHAATQTRLETDPAFRTSVDALRSYIDENVSAGDRTKGIDYGLSNAHEFIAAAMTSPEMQDLLSTMRFDANQAAYHGIDTAREPRTSLWRAFVGLVHRTFGLPATNETALEHAMNLGWRAMQGSGEQSQAIRAMRMNERRVVASNRITTDTFNRIRETLPYRFEGASQGLRQFGLGWMAGNQIRDVGAKLFGWADTEHALRAKAAEPLSHTLDALSAQGAEASRLRAAADPMVERFDAFKRTNGRAAEQLSQLMLDATRLNVHPDVPLSDAANGHLRAGSLDDAQAIKAHPQLARTYDALPAEAKAIYHETKAFFEKQHSDVVNQLLTNLMQNRHYELADEAHKAGTPIPAGPDFAALAQRVRDKALTDPDKAFMGDVLDKHVENLRRMSQIDGPYFPMRRHGDHVLQYETNEPAEQVFTSRAHAKAAIENARAPLQGVERQQFDAQGNRLTADQLKDPHVMADPSKERWVVRLNNQGVEFFDSHHELTRRRRELQADQRIASVSDPQLRSQVDAFSNTLSGQQLRQLHDAVGKMGLTPSQAEVTRQAISDAALRLLPGANARQAYLRRTGIDGASTDMLRSVANTASASANMLAKLRHSADVVSGMEGMKDWIKANRSSSGADTIKRQQILREMELRQRMAAVDTAGGGSTNPIMRKLQSLSFINMIASPSSTLVYAMQPWMLGLPHIGARYGLPAAARELARATAMLGPRSLLAASAKQMVRHIQGGSTSGLPGFHDIITRQVEGANTPDAAALGQMLRRFAHEGLIDSHAGMELRRASMPEQSAFSRGLQHAEDMARSMPNAAEVMSRAMTSIATYRLAIAKGLSEAEAMAAARKAVIDTQFDYSSANQPRFFDARKYPWLAPAFTFKKYATGLYWLVGHSAYQSIKGMTPEERTVARRQFAMLMASHVLMAGTLGLPTDPIKLVAGAAALAMGEDQPYDWEGWYRTQLANAVGKEAGEVIAHGLPNAIGLDLSHRVGLDGLLWNQDVRDFKSDTISGDIGNFLLGAPGSTMLQGFNAAQQMRNGNTGKAVEALLPRVLRDGIRAFRYGDAGETSASGHQVFGPIGSAGMFYQALGFTPSSVSEGREAQASIANAAAAQKTGRAHLVDQWIQGAGQDRSTTFAAVQRFNAANPHDKITMVQLQQAERRHRMENRPGFVPKRGADARAAGAYANTGS